MTECFSVQNDNNDELSEHTVWTMEFFPSGNNVDNHHPTFLLGCNEEQMLQRKIRIAPEHCPYVFTTDLCTFSPTTGHYFRLPNFDVTSCVNDKNQIIIKITLSQI